MFGEFAAAMDRGESVVPSAVNALRCIEVITTAYESANDGSRERPIVKRG
jgi:hypothetical protein